jgi:hypothetical protein
MRIDPFLPVAGLPGRYVCRDSLSGNRWLPVLSGGWWCAPVRGGIVALILQQDAGAVARVDRTIDALIASRQAA